MESPDDVCCDGCGEVSKLWRWWDYFCPSCGHHADALYISEHYDPDRAKDFTRADIMDEYAAAGIPFGAIA